MIIDEDEDTRMHAMIQFETVSENTVPSKKKKFLKSKEKYECSLCAYEVTYAFGKPEHEDPFCSWCVGFMNKNSGKTIRDTKQNRKYVLLARKKGLMGPLEAWDEIFLAGEKKKQKIPAVQNVKLANVAESIFDNDNEKKKSDDDQHETVKMEDDESKIEQNSIEKKEEKKISPVKIGMMVKSSKSPAKSKQGEKCKICKIECTSEVLKKVPCCGRCKKWLKMQSKTNFRNIERF